MAFAVRLDNWQKRLQAPSVTLFGVLASLLSLLFLIQLIRLIWLAFTPLAPVGSWQPDLPRALDNQQQAALFSRYDPFFSSAAPVSSGDKVTSLALTLYGTRGDEMSGAGSAIIGDAEGVQASYLVGEEIMPGVKLHKVAFDHVEIDNQGSIETLWLDQSSPADDVDVEAAAQKAANADDAANDAPAGKVDPQKLASSLSFTPRRDNGSVTGLVIGGPADALSSAGLKQGDILTKVNGRAVTASSDITALLRPGARLSLEIERGAETLSVAVIL